MNTFTRMFSLCLCLSALIFAASDSKLSENNLKPISLTSGLEMEKNNLQRGPSLDYSPSSRDCAETFIAFGVDPNGSYESCWTDGSGYFYFYWEGGCQALTLNYSGGDMDLTAYGFTEGFYFYGFDPGATETFLMTFDDGSTGASEATSECATCEELGQIECWDGSCANTEAECPEEGDCGDGFVIDCVDTDCCPESWIGDGFEDCEDQAYGCDLTCYDNDGGDCGAGGTDGGTDGGTTGGTESCDDCEFDWSAYGSECCDTAWDDFGINCADLEGTYGWDCAGCSCPGDSGTDGGTDGGGDCAAGTVEDCDGTGECFAESWVGDGLCDGNSQEWGANLCCYDNDGGDCTDAECTNCSDSGQVECWDGSCADTADGCPEQPEIATPGICAEGTTLYDAPAVSVTWFIETVCGDGICNGDEDYYNCPDDCNAPGECDDGYVPDCVDDDCCPESWIGDGFEDCEDQAYGCDLTCYDNDGGDCGAGGTDGGTDGGTTGGTESCDDCEFDWSAYGSECCDTAWDEFGINCADLEGTYGWDCAGCGCPGDGEPECGDGSCNGDETYETCPDDCNAPGECSDGDVVDCVDPSECWVESWIGDTYCDGTAEQYGANLCCYDLDGGDCTEAECAEGRDTSDEPKAIKDVMENLGNIKKGVPYSRLALNSAPFHGQFDSPSNREVLLNVTFEVLSGYNAGFINTWQADPSLGEFTVYGFGADDFVCATAQACDGAACGDVVGPVCVMAGAMDGVQECVEGAGGDPCDGTVAGDANLDEDINVLDIVQIVNHILESALLTDECALLAADFTADGDVNVLDIVQIVNIILEGRITGDASSATLKNVEGHMTINADGYIGGVQMTLSHGLDFSINVTDKALVADYNTMGNTTKLVIVAPESNELFTATGDFTIDEMIIANSNSQVDVVMPTELKLSKAYPNPFNPSTSLEMYVPAEGFVNLNVYNVMGQLVDVIHSGSMSQGYHSITWNASSMTSGVYFVRAESASGMSVQKVMLMK